VIDFYRKIGYDYLLTKTVAIVILVHISGQ